jgi:hypothetical protein
MPPLLYPPTGPQTIGQVLDTGFRMFKVSLVRCLLYGAVSMIAGQLPNFYSLMVARTPGSLGFRDPVWVGLYVVSVLVSITLYGALVIRQHRIVSGQRTSMRQEIAATLRRLPGFLGVTLVFLLLAGLWVGIFVALAMATGLSAGLAGGLRVGPIILLCIAALPVIYLSVPLSFFVAALLVDGRKAFESATYCIRLVWGSWWRTTAIYTIVLIVVLAFYFVATIAAGVLAFSLAGADLVAMSASAAVVYVALGAIGLPFSTATMLAMFGELKVRREAVDLEARLGDVAARS